MLTLENDIFEEMSKTLKKEATYDEDYLKEIIKDVIEEVKEVRNYPDYYTNGMILDDLRRLKGKIKRIAKFDYNQIGGEGEQSHSENGTSRTYVDRNSLFAGIIPLSRTGR